MTKDKDKYKEILERYLKLRQQSKDAIMEYIELVGAMFEKLHSALTLQDAIFRDNQMVCLFNCAEDSDFTIALTQF